MQNLELIYTGIGSRTVPPEYRLTMHEIGKRLAVRGWTLRSGAAAGSDQAFERGADLVIGCKKEIFVPWNGFENRYIPNIIIPTKMVEAKEIASKYHPTWKTLKESVRCMMARNVCQVLGDDLNTPTRLVIAYTENGELKGGTAQALRIAHDLNIDVINIGGYKFREQIWELIIEKTFQIEKEYFSPTQHIKA